jgi:outer membrane protein assembly factor BamB
MKTTRIILLFLLPALLTAASAQENSQWRGASRNGVYPETGLLKAWPPEGPRLLWHYDGLGEGHTSVAAANSRIYVTGMTDSTGYLYVFDLQGRLLHRKPYGLEWNTNYNGSRSTVHVNGGKLYLFSARGVLSCLDEQTLEKVWEKNLLTDFDGNNLKFGMTESPLIAGDTLYATPGGEKHNVVALNRHTGELIWSSPGAGKPSTYCSPQYVGGLETPLVVNAIDSSLVAFHARTGECLWTVDQKNPYGMSPNTPLAEGDRLFSTTGGGIGSVMLRLTDGGRSAEKVWTHEMDSKMGGAVKIGNYVYGSGEKNRYWYCIDWNTGETRYKSNAVGTGNIIAADGMLYCYSDRGEMALVKATPEGFQPTGKFKITLGTDQHWAHPVIHKGVLYVRHGNTLMAYQIR